MFLAEDLHGFSGCQAGSDGVGPHAGFGPIGSGAEIERIGMAQGGEVAAGADHVAAGVGDGDEQVAAFDGRVDVFLDLSGQGADFRGHRFQPVKGCDVPAFPGAGINPHVAATPPGVEQQRVQDGAVDPSLFHERLPFGIAHPAGTVPDERRGRRGVVRGLLSGRSKGLPLDVIFFPVPDQRVHVLLPPGGGDIPPQYIVCLFNSLSDFSRRKHGFVKCSISEHIFSDSFSRPSRRNAGLAWTADCLERFSGLGIVHILNKKNSFLCDVQNLFSKYSVLCSWHVGCSFLTAHPYAKEVGRWHNTRQCPNGA